MLGRKHCRLSLQYKSHLQATVCKVSAENSEDLFLHGISLMFSAVTLSQQYPDHYLMQKKGT